MKRISGFAFHCHHDTLCEWVSDYDEWVDYIKEYKPPQEIELRLRLFQMIPEERLPEELVKAWTAYDKARTAYDKAWTACVKAGTACDKAWTAYDKAWTASDKARTAYDKALTACVKARTACDKAIVSHTKELEKLHAELCPNCTWDGKTIFKELK